MPERVRVDASEARTPLGVHRVSEWPVEQAGRFSEAPAVARLADGGQLPAVEARLPENTLVIHPPRTSRTLRGNVDAICHRPGRSWRYVFGDWI